MGSLFSLSLTKDSQLQKQFSLGINIQVPTAEAEALNEQSRGRLQRTQLPVTWFSLDFLLWQQAGTKRSPRGAALPSLCQGLRPKNAFPPPLVLLINFVCLVSFFKAFPGFPIRTWLTEEKENFRHRELGWILSVGRGHC